MLVQNIASVKLFILICNYVALPIFDFDRHVKINGGIVGDWPSEANLEMKSGAIGSLKIARKIPLQEVHVYISQQE